jgi:hypothetical protein
MKAPIAINNLSPPQSIVGLIKEYEVRESALSEMEVDALQVALANLTKTDDSVFSLLLGHEVMPFVLENLIDLRADAFHNIDEEDFMSVLNIEGNIRLGSASLPDFPKNEVLTRSLALALADALGLSRASGFICFVDSMKQLSQGRLVMNTFSAGSAAESHRLYGLKTGRGTLGIFRFTVLAILPLT